MADIDDLFNIFEDPLGFDEVEVANPVVVQIDDNEEAITPFKAEKRPLNDIEDDENKQQKKQRIEENTESILDDIRLEDIETRITVHVIDSPHSCLHEVAVYPGQPFVPLTESKNPPAKKYPFLLDPFQKEAILCIENNQSVLVSAHTSAGKTVVAEYAIARALSDKQRVIYTTPIKALSNQKYREFNEEFKDVGLVTGDVKINPNASCLIMTTEILRDMLFHGSEVMREVGWVVFDEIHYMRDKERGVVWEESLILLPDNVHYVFLSATIPNARQFCEWVCCLHKQPCHVVYTDYRPTPLQHYLFPVGGDGIYLVVDDKGQFKESNFDAAMSVLAKTGEAAKGNQKGRKDVIKGVNAAQSNIFKIVNLINEQCFAPVVIFSFSKKDCESYATQIAKLDFNSAEEKALVDEVFDGAMEVLSKEDRCLPQIQNILPLLRRGIGIHHGGLLPILKETVEILFAEGLIKALFATETFAMGLNMPASTVLFTSSRKFDSKELRFITSGEYIQMSGRAGRRGLDQKGTVILMIDEQVTKTACKKIIQGSADPINSAFHLTYHMVLNLLRVEEINPEYILERSFSQFQSQSKIPDLYRRVQKQREAIGAIEIPNESSIATYYHIRDQMGKLGKEFRSFLTKPLYLVPFLQPGRLVKIRKDNGIEYDWGVIINYRKLSNGKKNPMKVENMTVADILLHVNDEYKRPSTAMPCPPNQTGSAEIIPVALPLIAQMSSVRIPLPDDLRPAANRLHVLKNVDKIKMRFPKGLPQLHPIHDMNIKDENFKSIFENMQKVEEQLRKHPLHESPQLGEMYTKYSNKMELMTKLKAEKEALRKAKSVLQMDELKFHKRVLRRLGFCTQSDVIELKGRVACELSSTDALLVTEMMLNGAFNTLTAGQIAALLSCFVCDERGLEVPKGAAELSRPFREMQDLARHIAKISHECKLEMDEEKYVEKLKPTLMDIVLAWCKGASFLSLCQMTENTMEGSIIRCMRRLREVLRQMSLAAKIIGNAELETKFLEGMELLKRDIVFAASLYL